MQTTTPGRLLRSSEAARLLGVHQCTVKRWAQRGLIPTVRVGAHTVRYDTQALEAWLQAGGRREAEATTEEQAQAA